MDEKYVWPNNFFRNVDFLCFEIVFLSFFYTLSLLIANRVRGCFSIAEIALHGPLCIIIYIWAIELSFPFTLPFISPRAINPFLLLTRANVTTRLIYFRSRSLVFFLSPPFDVATLDCSVNSASRKHPLSIACTRLPLPPDWWTAFKSIARISRISHATRVAISVDLR